MDPRRRGAGLPRHRLEHRPDGRVRVAHQSRGAHRQRGGRGPGHHGGTCPGHLTSGVPVPRAIRHPPGDVPDPVGSARLVLRRHRAPCSGASGGPAERRPADAHRRRHRQPRGPVRAGRRATSGRGPRDRVRGVAAGPVRPAAGGRPGGLPDPDRGGAAAIQPLDRASAIAGAGGRSVRAQCGPRGPGPGHRGSGGVRSGGASPGGGARPGCASGPDRRAAGRGAGARGGAWRFAGQPGRHHPAGHRHPIGDRRQTRWGLPRPGAAGRHRQLRGGPAAHAVDAALRLDHRRWSTPAPAHRRAGTRHRAGHASAGAGDPRPGRAWPGLPVRTRRAAGAGRAGLDHPGRWQPGHSRPERRGQVDPRGAAASVPGVRHRQHQHRRPGHPGVRP